METEPEERPEYDSLVQWPSNEGSAEPTDPNLVEVTGETRRFLEEKCTRGMTNEARKRTRSRYPLPKVAATRIHN